MHRIVSRPVSAVEIERDLFEIEWADPIRCPNTQHTCDELDRLLRRFDSFTTPVIVKRLESL
jgi:hypothetical protein